MRMIFWEISEHILGKFYEGTRGRFSDRIPEGISKWIHETLMEGIQRTFWIFYESLDSFFKEFWKEILKNFPINLSIIF